MAQQNPLPKPKFPGIADDHQQFLSQVVDSVNSLMGYNGQSVINAPLSVSGNPVQNVANPTLPTDALNLQTAEGKYSPTVVGPMLDVAGKNALPGLTYLYKTAPKFGDAETPKGTINGSNTVFTLAKAPSPPASLMLTLMVPAGLGGLMQYGGGVHYTLVGNQITMVAAPASGSRLVAWYRF